MADFDTAIRKTYARKDLAAMLPLIADNIHKGDRGSVLICGGSWNYRGAPVLAALGALRAGAGYVVMAVPDFMVDAASILLPEAVFAPVQTVANSISAESLETTVEEWAHRCKSAIIGPGMGLSTVNKPIIRYFWDNWKASLLIDADALTLYADIQEELHFRKDVVITPHTGEAAKILKTDALTIENGRAGAALNLTRKSGTALLKGKGTLIASNNEIKMITEGTSALAVPGSGDVLSGIIGAFMASGMTVFDAAVAGALAHACVGNDMMKKFGPRGTLARDIANGIPYVLR